MVVWYLLQIKLPTTPALISIITFCPILWETMTFNERHNPAVQSLCSLLSSLSYFVPDPWFNIWNFAYQLCLFLNFCLSTDKSFHFIKSLHIKILHTSEFVGFVLYQFSLTITKYLRQLTYKEKGFILGPGSGRLQTTVRWLCDSGPLAGMTEKTIHLKTQGTKNKRKTVDSIVLYK